ncbi:hypothetical protein C3V08_08675 [Campylobacter jejuni]|nr:hypothetical protein [Campylobacter jejuni]
MIEKSMLEKMTIADLSAMFEENKRSMNQMFNNSFVFVVAGINPETAIDDLFDEMKQIWLKKIEMERGK